MSAKYKVGDILIAKKVTTISEELTIKDIMFGSLDIYYLCTREDGTTTQVAEKEFEEI